MNAFRTWFFPLSVVLPGAHSMGSLVLHAHRQRACGDVVAAIGLELASQLSPHTRATLALFLRTVKRDLRKNPQLIFVNSVLDKNKPYAIVLG